MRKLVLQLSKKIALWDVIYSCEINGSSDSSIKNVKVNDIKTLIDNSNIKKFTLQVKKHTNYIINIV